MEKLDAFFFLVLAIPQCLLEKLEGGGRRGSRSNRGQKDVEKVFADGIDEEIDDLFGTKPRRLLIELEERVVVGCIDRCTYLDGVVDKRIGSIFVRKRRQKEGELHHILVQYRVDNLDTNTNKTKSEEQER